MTNQAIKFFKQTTVGTTGLITGGVYFETSTGLIKVATSETATDVFGGNIKNVEFVDNVLKITKATDSTPSIQLDFNDVASATGVNSLLATLRTDINSNADAIAAIQTALNDSATGVAPRVEALEGRMDTAEDDIDAVEGRLDTAEDDIDALEGRMDTAESDIDTLEGQVAALDSNKADKTQVEADIAAALVSALKYKGTKATFGALTAEITGGTYTPANGDVWNITTAGGTDSNGVAIKAGDNVACSIENDVVSWDVLAGTTDLSAYATNAALGQTNDAVAAIDTRVGTLETWTTTTSNYVKNFSTAHTNGTGTTATNMVTVTTLSKATGEVSVTIDESALDAKLDAMNSAISDAASAGVTSFANETGAITIDTATTTNGAVKFAMNDKNLTATVVGFHKFANESKLDKYTSAGQAATSSAVANPVYIASDGTPTAITPDTTVTSDSNNLVTSGAVSAAITSATADLQAYADNLMTWTAF